MPKLRRTALAFSAFSELFWLGNTLINYLDLFSGIGGFALGAKMAELPIHKHYFSEIDTYAASIYQKNFPNAIALGSVVNVNGKALRSSRAETWVITGGFPCQDIAPAGNGKGISGNRSNLWFEMLRVIDELRPEIVIAENVPALCSRGLERVLLSLAKAGYDAEWECISAASVGAYHKRERVWIIAYPDCNTKPQHLESFTTGDNLADDNQSVGTAPGLMSQFDWHAVETARTLCDKPLVVRVDDGVPDWLDRTKCLGNAIVPQIACKLFNRVKPRLYDYFDLWKT